MSYHKADWVEPNWFDDHCNNMNNKEIFTKPFSGSIDDLLAHTDANADFVDRVNSGQEDFMLTREEAINDIIEQSGYTLSREGATQILDEIMLAEVNESIKGLMAEGLVEIKDYGEKGEPRYGLTPQGESTYQQNKNP